MLLPYWDYYIEKSWNYTLYTEILHSNIFCYGKPNSGRTKKVAIPVAEAAITEGKSCIIYSEKADEKYSLIRTLAQQKGYELIDCNAAEQDDEMCELLAEDIIDNIVMDIPTLVIVKNPNFKEACQSDLINYILDRLCEIQDTFLYERAESKKNILKNDRKNSVLIILDGLCGNMFLEEDILKQKHLQFCIVMDSKIAYLPWLNNTINNLTNIEDFPYDNIEKYRDILNIIIMHRFFSHMETIICTGINGVKPEMHRQFIGQHLFGIRTARIGGKFVIMEYPPKESNRAEKCRMHSPGKKVDINEENIETSTYSEIAEERIQKDSWILEQDGKLSLYFDDEVYVPITFRFKSDALNWLASKARKENMNVLHLEQDDNMVSCEFHNETEKIEFFLVHLNDQDVETYRIGYLLRVLEMGEYEDIVEWIQTEEAISQGFNPSDGIEHNIQKYYANLKTAEEMDAAEAAAKAQNEATLPPIPPVEPYWEIYRAKKEEKTAGTEPIETVCLPEKGILFLGGHINMVKKIKQLHPGWIYITDDELKSNSTINVQYVFYWTNHSSHKMMENIFGRLTPDAEIIYVTATNMDRLENEMLTKLIESQNRKVQTVQ